MVCTDKLLLSALFFYHANISWKLLHTQHSFRVPNGFLKPTIGSQFMIRGPDDQERLLDEATAVAKGSAKGSSLVHPRTCNSDYNVITTVRIVLGSSYIPTKPPLQVGGGVLLRSPKPKPRSPNRILGGFPLLVPKESTQRF